MIFDYMKILDPRTPFHAAIQFTAVLGKPPVDEKKIGAYLQQCVEAAIQRLDECEPGNEPREKRPKDRCWRFAVAYPEMPEDKQLWYCTEVDGTFKNCQSLLSP